MTKELFDELYNYYEIPNPKEIRDFCMIHEGLVEGLNHR